MTTSLPVKLSHAGAAHQSPGWGRNDSKSIDSIANSFAGMLARVLQSSSNGSQFEIGIVQTPNPESKTGQFTITVKNVTPNSVVDLGNAAGNAAANVVGDVAPNAAVLPSPKPIVPPISAPSSAVVRGYPSGSEAFIEKFGSGPTSASEPPRKIIPKPDFYQPPPTKSVGGVKTLESYMQEELALAEYGTEETIKGTNGFHVKQLTDAFRTEAQRNILTANANTDPSVAPSNWAQIADQYSSMYMQWLTKTDAGYWDPKLSGPIYDPSTGIVQTSAGPVDIFGAPVGSISVG